MSDVSIASFKMLLAKRIKQLRLAAGLTQGALAFKLGFKDKQVVNNYEVNGANPTAYNLVQLAKALNVSLDELLDFSKLEEE